MPTKPTLLPLLLFGVSLLSGCAEHSAPAKIDRLDLAIADSATALSAPRQQAMDEWIEIIGNNSNVDNYRRSDAFRMFLPVVETDLPALDSVETVIGGALARLNDSNTRLYGILSPYRQSVVTHPSGTVLIGLNHYLGADHKLYTNFPAFERKRKTLRRMPVDVVEAVIARDNPAELPADATLLNHLLYQGALLEATSQALAEDTPDSTLYAMTADEVEWCATNEARMWNTLIERNLLYSTDSGVIRRLLSPTPASTLINANAPGQAALFLGRQIARSYLDNNPDATVNDLLKPDYYANSASLVKSKYSPANATR